MHTGIITTHIYLSIIIIIIIIIIINYHNTLWSSSTLSPSIYLSIYLTIYLTIFLSIKLSFYLSIYLTIFLSINLTIIGMVPLYITWRPVVIFLPVVQNQKNNFQEFMKIGRRNRSNYERTVTNDVI